MGEIKNALNKNTTQTTDKRICKGSADQGNETTYAGGFADNLYLNKSKNTECHPSNFNNHFFPVIQGHWGLLEPSQQYLLSEHQAGL